MRVMLNTRMEMDMKIAVLAVQGAFIEHEKMLESLGTECVELRKKEDLEQEFDGLILPGGESTVQGKLIKELGMEEIIKEKIKGNMPVLATCAGMILLADEIANDDTVHLGLLPAKVRRNAYGRQLGSFYTEEEFDGIGKIPMTFIRAPYVEGVKADTQVLARVDGKIVAVKNKNILALSFHPELDDDLSIHKYFMEMVKESKLR